MRHHLNAYIKRKQRRRRFWLILLLTVLMAVSVVLLQECQQKFTQPYNNDYRPLDKLDTSMNELRGFR